MNIADIFKQYMEHLFTGNRCSAREMIMAAQDRGVPASKLLTQVIWAAMDQIDKLYRNNNINSITEHMAHRINRMIADQLQPYLNREPKNGRRMIVTCGNGEGEELGAQMTADLFESVGWSVWYLGSGVPNDEILTLVGKIGPDVLCIFGAQPCGVTNVKRLIGMVRDIGVCSDMQILVTGGVFSRAEGLADEIKADLFAPTIGEALQIVADHPVRVPQPDVPQPGRRRKRRNTALPAMRKSKVAIAG